MATQIMDEARHLEVFRKRALANGGGLGKCPPEVEEGLKYIFDLRSFPQMLARLHLCGEGRVLTLFRLGELIAQNEVEKTIFRLCAQDEARHLAFGCLQLRYLIDQDPDRIEEIHEALDIAEQRVLELGATPEQVEPLLILLGGGVDHMQEGMEKFAFIHKKTVQEYLQRCLVLDLASAPRPAASLACCRAVVSSRSGVLHPPHRMSRCAPCAPLFAMATCCTLAFSVCISLLQAAFVSVPSAGSASSSPSAGRASSCTSVCLSPLQRPSGDASPSPRVGRRGRALAARSGGGRRGGQAVQKAV